LPNGNSIHAASTAIANLLGQTRENIKNRIDQTQNSYHQSNLPPD
jgi:hypothetical protein